MDVINAIAKARFASARAQRVAVHKSGSTSIRSRHPVTWGEV